MSVKVQSSIFKFLNELQNNNDRTWFAENKDWFTTEDTKLKTFFTTLMHRLSEIDDIEDMKAYRIYRDVRFSKDKSPYKIYRSCSFKRATEALRGGYHIEIKPENSFIACGFWQPNKEDLLRIRKEIEVDASELRSILQDKELQKVFGGFYAGDALKTAPKGFDKLHADIDLLRKKDFLFLKTFTKEEVLNPNFIDQVVCFFKVLRPFLNYMSTVLTTDLNGESTI